jgi:hypothetical protein
MAQCPKRLVIFVRFLGFIKMPFDLFSEISSFENVFQIRAHLSTLQVERNAVDRPFEVGHGIERLFEMWRELVMQ